MPNHVRNVWKIKGIKTKEEKEYLLNKLTCEFTNADEKKERIIDFDLIIPEPRYKQDCQKQYIVNSKSHVEEDKDRPWFNWYDWHIEYWGTKWNAYDGYTVVDDTQLMLVFSTAWSFPMPIAVELEHLGYELELKYADEAIGSNCGIVLFNPAADYEDDKWTMQNESSIPNPDKFAEELWDNY